MASPCSHVRLVTWFCHFCIPNSPHTLLVLLLHSAIASVQLTMSWTLEEPPPVLPPATVQSPKCWSEAPRSCHTAAVPSGSSPSPSTSVSTLGFALGFCTHAGGGSAGHHRAQPRVGGRVHQHRDTGLSPLLLRGQRLLLCLCFWNPASS